MKREYIESDLGAASYLYALGYQLRGIREIGPTRSGFVFADPLQNASRDVELYFSGAAIGAEKLAISIRRLKAELRVKQSENMERKYDTPQHTRL